LSVREALAEATARLRAAGCETPRLDAEVLLAFTLDIERSALLTTDAAVPERFEELLRRREAREPVAYITGRRAFRRLELVVDPRVLIPRPETEHVVEAALGLPSRARVVDVGTGSGAIALALKDERPDLAVTGTDVSADALVVAATNADRLGLTVELAAGDLLEAVAGPMDAVVSNPPYVRDDEVLPPEVADFEPALALRAGPDGLDAYRRLVPQIAARAVAFCALEVGDGQAAAVGEMLLASGCSAVEAVRDLAGIERVVVGRW
jgi:release factor glutamine methyltransferase